MIRLSHFEFSIDLGKRNSVCFVILTQNISYFLSLSLIAYSPYQMASESSRMKPDESPELGLNIFFCFPPNVSKTRFSGTSAPADYSERPKPTIGSCIATLAVTIGEFSATVGILKTRVFFAHRDLSN